MKEFKIENIIRPNIKKLMPYSSARSEFEGTANIFLDANENSLGSVIGNNYNRYPDPLQKNLKKHIGKLKSIPPENIFLGNGSDEPIDLLLRAFCVPKKDNVVIFPPTYGMYEVAANINDVKVKKVLLSESFNIDADKALAAADANTRLMFICSPNNPTGNIINKKAIINILENFNGLLVADEAYIDFAEKHTLLKEVLKYPNLVVLQTFSKAWGMAGLRVGMAFAQAEIIAVLNKIKAPYNLNIAVQQLVSEALKKEDSMKKYVEEILIEKKFLESQLKLYSFIKKLYPGEANFILVKVADAVSLYKFLLAEGIVVRNRSRDPLCENCIRITVGSPQENLLLLNTLNNYEHE